LYKLKVISFAEQFGNRAAEREFGILESSVRYWRKQKALQKCGIFLDGTIYSKTLVVFALVLSLQGLYHGVFWLLPSLPRLR